MRTEEFEADTIDEAAERILYELKEGSNATRSASTRNNVIYFDGWDGLGASAVLRAVARRLTTTSNEDQPAPAGLEFEQIIHIDCSNWESRRALQRAVAEQLKLPDEVMEMFDRQDEEDDFRGVAQGSRAELQEVVREMYRHTMKRDSRFLVIFHNGSSEEIDLASFCGFPLSGYSTSMVLWTFQGRFRLKPQTKVDMALKSAGTTDLFLSAIRDKKDPLELWSYLVHQEAPEVVEVAAHKINTSGTRDAIDQPAQVAECFFYMLELCWRDHHSIDYDLTTHGANYWVCDSILQQLQQGERDAGTDDDGSWRAADALQREMRLDVDYHRQYLPSHLARCAERNPYWTSPKCGFLLIPTGAIPSGDMFQHYFDKLSVLKLSRCTFNFQSPPFLCCRRLRFLWLDHCQGTGISTDGAGKEEDIRRCFQRLWVLDVRYTCCDQILSARMMDLMTQLRELNVTGAANEWDMGQMQGRLPNIRKLRVTESAVRCSCSENDLFSEMSKMELLDFSGNYRSTNSRMTSLTGPGISSNSSCLETVFVKYCELEQISLRGCTNLKNLFLSQYLGNLRTLDISGTAVKTLDLTTTRIYELDELFLLDCEKLCAILWPPKDKMKEDLAKLFIDTTQSTSTARSKEEKAKGGSTAAAGILSSSSAAATVLHGGQPTTEFHWYISVRDARLLVSLEPVYSSSRDAYVEVSSPTHPTVAAGGSKDEGIKSDSSSGGKPAPAIYAAIRANHLQQASEGDGDAPTITWMWPCPDAPDLRQQKSCYMHIQDQTRTKLPRRGEEATTITVPGFVLDCAKILHVHDSLSITILPSATKMGSEWHNLEWCRIERCPRLDCIFTSHPRGGIISYKLRTFWASQLPKARYIWTWSESRTFPDLTFLHLDCCPRLIHVLPFSWPMLDEESFPLSFVGSLPQLETLEIVWCGDLREVFPLDTRAKSYVEGQPGPVTAEFPKLKRIHLQEVPMLRRMCGVRMWAPNLESVRIRGCWSLTRLPVVGGGKVVECDCEKEWWEKLEWEDASHASHYRPIHSRYYKKTMLRSSVLR